jgi:hypothetical protein
MAKVRSEIERKSGSSRDGSGLIAGEYTYAEDPRKA